MRRETPESNFQAGTHPTMPRKLQRNHRCSTIPPENRARRHVFPTRSPPSPATLWLPFSARFPATPYVFNSGVSLLSNPIPPLSIFLVYFSFARLISGAYVLFARNSCSRLRFFNKGTRMALSSFLSPLRK